MFHDILLIVFAIFLFGEYIPFSQIFWQKVGFRMKALGEWFFKYENRLYPEKEVWVEKKVIKLRLKNFFLKVLLFFVATIVVIILEIVWELGFKGLSNQFKKSRFATWAEERIKELPNWAVLVLFGAPFIVMELLGFIAVGALVSGYIWLGISLYLFKVLFFIPVHFVLHVGEDQLMQVSWFRRRFMMIKDLLNWFKQSQTYVKVHNVSETVAAYIRAVKNLFLKAVIHMKKAFEGEDILSPECEEVRQEILTSEQERGVGQAKKELYVRLFDCINKHIKELKAKSK